jgi:hypothetical protein
MILCHRVIHQQNIGQLYQCYKSITSIKPVKGSFMFRFFFSRQIHFPTIIIIPNSNRNDEKNRNKRNRSRRSSRSSHSGIEPDVCSFRVLLHYIPMAIQTSSRTFTGIKSYFRHHDDNNLTMYFI